MGTYIHRVLVIDGYLYSRVYGITSMVISIRNTDSVGCREVVRFSEGPLSEARL